MKFKVALFTTFILGQISFAQTKDTIVVNKLSEVVVTGQFKPQSVNKSVFQVKVITREDIDRQVGNNLADLLNQTLNISIIPNASTGKSGVQLFGLDAQYFKILVDNIPIINDEGLGNNTDLTQINLDDIQQIEIIEGSMGVEYGANAVSGIINVITKKSSKYKWEITPYIQEETVGDEYDFTNEGRHIQSLKIGHNFNSKLYANGVITTNNFEGYKGNKQGENYLEDDGLRGYEWLPKNQLNLKSLLSYSLKNHQFFYKFEYFNEEINKYASEVLPNYNPPTETTNPTANDQIFTSTRFYHHLNASGKFDKSFNYDVSLSYQQQKSEVENYNYFIRLDEKTDIQKFKYESQQGLYSKGNFTNFLKNGTIDFQLGYEISSIDGYASASAGTFNGENINRKLGSYDVFGGFEINFNKRFSLRPGTRILFSSQFATQTALSLSSKYLLNNGFELRGILGTSPRIPNYEELYTYFVDVNHDVRGNANLNPEQGVSAFLHLNKTSNFKSGVQLQNKLSAWFINVKDRIELIVVNETPLAYQYNNIDLYKTWGTSLTNSFAYKNLTFNTGITFAGISKVIGSELGYNNDDYLYGIQLNANASYAFPKYKTTLSAFIKYNGPQYQFVQKKNEVDENVFVKGKQNDFTWLDATIKKSLLKDKFEITAGARNILNITSVNTTASQGGAHTDGGSSIQLGYGRSYFLKVLYKLNF